jgi:hypothetical protein
MLAGVADITGATTTVATPIQSLFDSLASVTIA